MYTSDRFAVKHHTVHMMTSFIKGLLRSTVPKALNRFCFCGGAE